MQCVKQNQNKTEKLFYNNQRKKTIYNNQTEKFFFLLEPKEFIECTGKTGDHLMLWRFRRGFGTKWLYFIFINVCYTFYLRYCCLYAILICFFSFKLSVKITAIVRGWILIGTRGEQWTWSIYYANAVYVCLLVIGI